GDPVPPGDELVAARAARLLRVAEETAARVGTTESVSYAIGTELPVPRGAPRAARLLRVAEEPAARVGTTESVCYVIGTEVPVPGGAHETLGKLTATPAPAARHTLDRHRAAFAAVGLEHVWPRVAALVVQPAVEFDH